MTYRSVIVSDVELSVKKRVKQSFGLDVFKKNKYLVWCGATFIGVLGYLIPIVIIVSKQGDNIFLDGLLISTVNKNSGMFLYF